jgi:tetratricopeptide (TPR) repeat protein
MSSGSSGVNERQLGVDLFNDVWRLLEQPDRTREEDDELLHQAHASAYHWLKAPECEPKNRARSEWMCSRVYAVLGRAEPALHHAERCLEITEANPENIDDWDIPFAYEALARAYGLAGNGVEARRHEERARDAAVAIADPEDREHLEEALATLGS